MSRSHDPTGCEIWFLKKRKKDLVTPEHEVYLHLGVD